MPLDLIDKKDNFELIRDEIAAILAVETTNQQAKAVLASKNPDLWKFDVYIERSRIWDSMTDVGEPVFPIINVWFESAGFDGATSYNALMQTADPGIFNIDIFTVALNKKNAGDGYISADRQAVLDCQRVVRLIRNILYSVPADAFLPGEDYTFLNMRGIVGYRKINGVTMFQPDYEKQSVIIAAARIALAVKYGETSLEGPENDFDLLQAQTTTTLGGQVTMQFDLT